MKAKLNLTIETRLLARVKRYAAHKKLSVSELVENYFTRLTRGPEKKSILDVLDATSTPPVRLPADLKEAYFQEQKGKHGF
ncbi:MAG: DUF6364 family protein [Cyclobacteriaceae bacterium]|jgi:hypothetical protein|nr:hypothetical protein [Cytophagales bacterium]